MIHNCLIIKVKFIQNDTLWVYYLKSKKINIIADGAGYHKSKKVKESTKDKNIEIHTLPPYSPNLNLLLLYIF